MATAAKDAAIAELADNFRNSDAAVLTEYRGLTVAQLTQLRNDLREHATYAVVKNTLTAIAARESGIDAFEGKLSGPTAIAFIKGEPVDAAKAKWWTSQVQSEVLDHCVQLHGGYGYMNEYRVARAWCDARINKIWAGTNEIMKELIGRDLGL